MKSRDIVPIQSLPLCMCTSISISIRRIEIEMDDIHMSKNGKWMLSYSKINGTNVNSITKFSVKCTMKQIALRMNKSREREKRHTHNHNRMRLFNEIVHTSEWFYFFFHSFRERDPQKRRLLLSSMLYTSCSQVFKSKLQLSHFVQFSHILSLSRSLLGRCRWQSHLHMIKCTKRFLDATDDDDERKKNDVYWTKFYTKLHLMMIEIEYCHCAEMKR